MTRSEALAALRLLVKPGDTIYTLLRFRSKFNHISVFVVSDGRIVDISRHVAEALGLDMSDEGIIKYVLEGGNLVLDLGIALWPDKPLFDHVWL